MFPKHPQQQCCLHSQDHAVPQAEAQGSDQHQLLPSTCSHNGALCGHGAHLGLLCSSLLPQSPAPHRLFASRAGSVRKQLRKAAHTALTHGPRTRLARSALGAHAADCSTERRAAQPAGRLSPSTAGLSGKPKGCAHCRAAPGLPAPSPVSFPSQELGVRSCPAAVHLLAANVPLG